MIREFVNDMLKGYAIIGEQNFGMYFGPIANNAELPCAACAIGCVVIGSGRYAQFTRDHTSPHLYQYDGIRICDVKFTVEELAAIGINWIVKSTLFDMTVYMNDNLKWPIEKIAEKWLLLAEMRGE